MPVEISKTIESMAVAGLHYGAHKAKKSPTTKGYVFGTRGNLEIIDLDKTHTALERAKEFVRGLGKEGKQILFVGNKGEARSAVVSVATSINQPYVALRWMGGTLTNFDEIRKRVDKLTDWREQDKKGELAKYTKRERGNMSFTARKLERFFEGIIEMKALPSAMIVIDSKKEHAAILEARAFKIPVVSLSSTDCNIRDIEYPIVGNDKSVPSINLILGELASAYREGRGALEK